MSTKFVRLSGALLVFLLLALWAGCGDYYRPVALPLVPAQPNPAFAHLALVLTTNGSNNQGSSTTIDVSGDTATSQATVGIKPAYALVTGSGTSVFVANSGDDTVSQFSPNTPTPVTTISLPSGSAPDFLASTETLAVYVANAGNSTVSVISTADNVVGFTIPVGGTPIAMAEIPNAEKLYVVNGTTSSGTGSVLSINTIDRTTNAPISTWVSPVWVVARSDSQRVYVLDKGAGTVTAIDTSFDTVVGRSSSVGVGAEFMTYDPKLNRIYVTNPVNNTLTALDANTDALNLTANPVSITSPVAVAALVDGSRVYVSSAIVSGSGGSQTVASSITVLNAGTLAVKKTIPLATKTPGTGCPSVTWSELSIAAAADGTRVYVGNCDAENTAIIQTSDDTLLVQIPAPAGAFNSTTPTVQKPILVVAGP